MSKLVRSSSSFSKHDRRLAELITRETEIADYLAREFAGPIMEPWIKATGDIRAPMSAFALISPAQGLRIRDGEHTIKAFDPRVMAT